PRYCRQVHAAQARHFPDARAPGPAELSCSSGSGCKRRDHSERVSPGQERLRHFLDAIVVGQTARLPEFCKWTQSPRKRAACPTPGLLCFRAGRFCCPRPAFPLTWEKWLVCIQSWYQAFCSNLFNEANDVAANEPSRPGGSDGPEFLDDGRRFADLGTGQALATQVVPRFRSHGAEDR